MAITAQILDAPHVSPLGRMASRVASPSLSRPSNLAAMALRLAASEDGFLYHVTYYKDLGSIAGSGLAPGGGGSMGKGGYSGHSRGRTFMTEADGLSFWFGRMEEHAEGDSDDPLGDGYVPVVLRFPEPGGLAEDEAGTSDAGAGSYYLEDGVPPDDVEVWDGSSWIGLGDWGSIDPSASFDTDEADGEEWHVFKGDNPLLPDS